ncbi:hypothetical protein WAI453_000201 [Rhynchosporium graminicola]
MSVRLVQHLGGLGREAGITDAAGTGIELGGKAWVGWDADALGSLLGNSGVERVADK